MKKVGLIIGVISATLLVALILFFSAFAIRNTTPEDCTVVEMTITSISEGSTFDIVFENTYNSRFYINRGLEQGLNLESLKTAVLNKTVTLHLAKLPIGTSHHISQLAVGDDILFTEFD